MLKTSRVRHPALLLIGPLPPPAGGIASSVESLASAAVHHGIDVRVVDPARGKLRLVKALLSASLAKSVVHVHVCGHNWACHALIAFARALAPKSRFIVTLHSGILPEFLRRLSPLGRGALLALLARVDELVCVSAKNRDALASIGVPAEKISVASPFIAERSAAPGSSSASTEVDRPKSIRLCAMVAPEALYGADLLVDGFATLAADLPATELYLFGTGGADRAVADALSTRGLAARVRALGELSRAEVHTLLRDSDLLVRPTYADGDSVNVREALSVGCRVVASDAAVRPPAVRTFPTGDAAAFASAMAASLAESPPALAPERAIDDGFETLLGVYGWSATSAL